MTELKLKRFLTISVASVIVICLIWTQTGKYYTVLMAHTLSPMLPSGTMLSVEDETFSLTVRRDLIPIEITFTGVDGEKQVAESVVDVSEPKARDMWFSTLSNSTPVAYTTRLDPRVIQSGLIPALAVMVALPAISYVAHIMGLIIIVSASFAAHVTSLYMVIQRYEWQANHSLETRHEHDVFIVTGYHVGLLVPMIVLGIIVFFRWRHNGIP